MKKILLLSVLLLVGVMTYAQQPTHSKLCGEAPLWYPLRYMTTTP